jgi:hypothetical protein
MSINRAGDASVADERQNGRRHDEKGRDKGSRETRALPGRVSTPTFAPERDQHGSEQADGDKAAHADTDRSRQVRSRADGRQQLREQDRRGGQHHEPCDATNDKSGFVFWSGGQPQRWVMR